MYGVRTNWNRGKVVTAVDSIRRIPAWEPKEGEAVFVLRADESVDIAKVKCMSGSIAIIKLQSGRTGRWNIQHLKPFDTDKIGLEWDEI